ncbi:MAG: diguanylate cyclase [Zoogloeaceae bacterium]|nr:diguanylate cyclase [Zoogloeaceae bacterium]
MSELPRILIVDDSRMVRTSLSRHLQGRYEVREEHDGESAWQTLVLDHTIMAVISDLQMPVLDGFGLLERIRSCRLTRLREIPFILISGDDDPAIHEQAGRLGVSDFINKDIKAAELKARLHNLLQYSLTRQSLADALAGQTQDAKTGLFTRRYVELQIAQALSHAARHNLPASLLIISFDNYPLIVEQMGEKKVEEIGAKFAQKVAGKVRQEDCVGHFSPGCFAIVSPGTALESCVIFANRLRHAISEAIISVGNRRMPLTMSVGIAGTPRDAVSSAEDMMKLAYQRMEAAIAAGGNRTEAGVTLQTEEPVAALTLDQARSCLLSNRPEMVLAQLPELTRQMLPLLLLLQSELRLEFPIAALSERLAARMKPR